MTFTKRELYRITSKIYNLFKTQPELFKLKKLHIAQGWCITDEKCDDMILIDYRYEMVSTLIHECIHYLYRDMPESYVLEMEKNVVNQLSIKQIRSLIKRFATLL